MISRAQLESSSQLALSHEYDLLRLSSLSFEAVDSYIVWICGCNKIIILDASD